MDRLLTRLTRTTTDAPRPDGELLEAFLTERDGAAFESLVRRHGSMVLAVCFRVLRHRQDAEDAFQATFLVLAQKLRTVRKRASLSSWLHGVARRVALKAKAQAAGRLRHEHEVSRSATAPPGTAPLRSGCERSVPFSCRIRHRRVRFRSIASGACRRKPQRRGEARR